MLNKRNLSLSSGNGWKRQDRNGSFWQLKEPVPSLEAEVTSLVAKMAAVEIAPAMDMVKLATINMIVLIEVQDPWT